MLAIWERFQFNFTYYSIIIQWSSNEIDHSTIYSLGKRPLISTGWRWDVKHRMGGKLNREGSCPERTYLLVHK